MLVMNDFTYLYRDSRVQMFLATITITSRSVSYMVSDSWVLPIMNWWKPNMRENPAVTFGVLLLSILVSKSGLFFSVKRLRNTSTYIQWNVNLNVKNNNRIIEILMGEILEFQLQSSLNPQNISFPQGTCK